MPSESQPVRRLSAGQLSELWDGMAILAAPQGPAVLGKLREFNLRWFLPSLAKFRGLFLRVVAASFFIQALGLASPLFFQVVMDKVLVHKAMTTLDVLVVGFAIVSVFEFLLNVYRNYLFSHTTTRVDAELGSRLFGHLASLPLAWFQARAAGQTVARVRELDSLRNFITSTALTLVIDLGFAFIYFAVMWRYSRALTLLVLASLPVYALLSLLVTPSLRARLDSKFHFGAECQAFLVESVAGIETVKSLALEPKMQRRWEDRLAAYAAAGFRAQNLGQAAGQLAGLVQKMTTALIVYIGAGQVMDGLLTVGQLVAFNMIAGRVSGPILKLTQLWQDFQQAGISLRRLGDILNYPPEPGSESGLEGLPAIKGAVRLERVRFHYDPEGPPTIDDLSLEVPPGEIVGIVGASGSGKSTLAKLLQRLYPVRSGRVLLDGVDLALVDTAWLRRQIGVVLQENVLFNGTIRENIAFANPGLPLEKVEAAARLAGAHDFIMGMPKNYHTMVGERGDCLSGGQRQRLAIARILIGDPRILIFDEATSALDYESERAIQENMGVICKGRTVFIIAHRLSALRRVDRIFVLDGGRLAESGTPDDLMEKKGAYYRMVMAQTPDETSPGDAGRAGKGEAHDG
jgi:subfamily B ATP-binding cassette protein HlyB/CyaB